jgi:hypothetical protein
MYQRNKRQKTKERPLESDDNNDFVMVQEPSAPPLLQDQSLVIIPTPTEVIDTSDLSRRFSEARQVLSESLTKKLKQDKDPSPLVEIFTDTWSKKFNHFRKRGQNGFKYFASEDAKTYLSIVRLIETRITEQRRLNFFKRKTISSDVVKAQQLLIELTETSVQLSTPSELFLLDYTSNETTVVMSNDFEALTPSHAHIGHSLLLSEQEYERVQARKQDVELYVQDLELKISTLYQSIGDDDVENFDKVQQREFKLEFEHEINSFTQSCLCHFCTQDMSHLNSMLQ